MFPLSTKQNAVGIVWCLIAFSFATSVGWGQEDLAEGQRTLRSKSDQFIIAGQPVPANEVVLTQEPGMERLTTDVLAVAAERIKTDYLRVIGRKDNWKDNITLVINPKLASHDSLFPVAAGFKDGWIYRMEVPQTVSVEKLVRAIVTTLIREQVGRSLMNRAPNLPSWLSEGVTGCVFSHGAAPLVPHLAGTTLRSDGHSQGQAYHRNARRGQPSDLIRAALGEDRLMTFDELAFPTSFEEESVDAKRFKLSAHLFVYYLLELRDGREKVARTIDNLSDVLNWQTAFLSAFQEDFKSMLEVEKWWALVMAQFSSTQAIFDSQNGLSVVLNTRATFAQLEALLSIDTRLWAVETDQPMTNRLAVQDLVRNTPFDDHLPHVTRTVEQLAALIPRANPPLVLLVDGYYRALSFYVDGRRRASTIPKKSNGRWTSNPNIIIQRTATTLDQLDLLRANLKQEWEESTRVSALK